jgi:predicted MFS family arabinose efflux permease
MITRTAPTPFIRDRFTWLAYLMLGYFAYLQAGLGPVMPFLRAELHLSYTVASLHFSALAAGAIVSGLVADGLAARLGRRFVFWSGAAGMALGAVLLTLGRVVGVTVAAAFFMGTAGSLLLIMIQAALSDRHGSLRAIAFTESNVMASLSATLVPLIVGGFHAARIGWRGGVLVSVLAAVLIGWRFRDVKLPPGRRERVGGPGEPVGGRLPGRYWAFWLVLFLSVSAEWTMVYWGADFLENSVGLERSLAASLLSVFLLAMFCGRLVGSYLTRRMAATTILLAALLVALTGFFLFWLSTAAILNLAGFFITGLGVANLFPLTLSAATDQAPDLADKASARVSLGGGLAIFSAPFALGFLADRFGIHSAFGATAVLLLLALLVTWLASRAGSTASRHHAQTP